MTAATATTPTTTVESLVAADTASPITRLRSLLWLAREIARRLPGPSLLWLVGSILAGLVPTFQLWASGRLVNAITDHLTNRPGNDPWRYAAMMIFALVGARILSPINAFALALVRERGVPSIRQDIFRQATEIDLVAMEYTAFYDTVQRVGEQSEQSLQQMVTQMRDIVTGLIPAIGTTILLVSIDWRLAGVLILPLFPLLLQAFRTGSSMWDTLAEQAHQRRIAEYIAHRFSDRQAAKEIRLFGLRDTLLDRWQQHFTTTRAQMRWKATRTQLRVMLSSTLSDVFTYGGLVWLLTSDIVNVDAGGITIIMGAFMSIGNQTWSVMNAFRELGNTAGFAHDVRVFLALPTPFATDHLESRVARVPISATNVTFRYPGTGTNVTDGISLTIPAGQTIAIVGENGAGKTTLLKLLLGLYEPTSGEVCYGDRTVHDIPMSERHATFSAVFQQFARYPFTFGDNIALGNDDDADRLAVTLDVAHLNDAVREAPAGLDTILSPDLGGIDLSGGQWQRLAIARATLRNTPVIALDEPTAALDPMAEVEIFRQFANLANNRTTLLVSHRLGMARLADRIVVLENGHIVEDGTHRELLAANGQYAHLWELQARWYQ